MCQRVRHLDPALHVQLAAALHFHLAVHRKSKDTALPHPDKLLSAAISRDCELVATGDWKGVVRVWTAAGRLVATFDEHTERVTALAFNHDGTLLASGGFDEQLKVWKVSQPGHK